MGFEKEYLIIILIFVLILETLYIISSEFRFLIRKDECRTSKDCDFKKSSPEYIDKNFMCYEGKCIVLVEETFEHINRIRPINTTSTTISPGILGYYKSLTILDSIKQFFENLLSRLFKLSR
jgi:hypothetical protein